MDEKPKKTLKMGTRPKKNTILWLGGTTKKLKGGRNSSSFLYCTSRGSVKEES